jgi:hypothetical protein
MSFRGVTSADGNMNMTGVYELLVMLNSGYHANRDMVISIIGGTGGGDLLLWRVERVGSMPSYLAFRQGTTYYFLHAGITNLEQALGAISGGACGATYVDGANIIHSYFADRFVAEQPDVDAVLAIAPPDATFQLVGHSGGYPTAFYLANYLQIKRRGCLVRLFGLGGAKGMTAGYGGPLPASHYRLRHPDDIIPWLPPTLMSVVLPPGLLLPPAGFPVPLPWTHYGDGWTLNDDGRTESDPTATTDRLILPIPEFADHPQCHSLDAYLDNIEKYITREGVTSAFTVAKGYRTATDAAGPIAPDPPRVGADHYISVADVGRVLGVPDITGLTPSIVELAPRVVPWAADLVRLLALQPPPAPFAPGPPGPSPSFPTAAGGGRSRRRRKPSDDYT